MILYGLDQSVSKRRPTVTRFMWDEVDLARRWLREGLGRRLYEVPPRGSARPVEHIRAHGRLLGMSPRGHTAAALRGQAKGD